eukprot:SAG31_NODE_35915_length_318_cov_0.936073_2_plen_24_part_01
MSVCAYRIRRRMRRRERRLSARRR